MTASTGLKEFSASLSGNKIELNTVDPTLSLATGRRNPLGPMPAAFSGIAEGRGFRSLTSGWRSGPWWWCVSWQDDGTAAGHRRGIAAGTPRDLAGRQIEREVIGQLLRRGGYFLAPPLVGAVVGRDSLLKDVRGVGLARQQAVMAKRRHGTLQRKNRQQQG
jgi:hypothetical protein